MQGTLTFLGTGTSMGVPTLACECAVCASTDPARPAGFVASVLLRWNEPATGNTNAVLLSSTPGQTSAQQALRAKLDACGRPVFYHAWTRRSHSRDGRFAPAELYCRKEWRDPFRSTRIERRLRSWSERLPTLSRRRLRILTSGARREIVPLAEHEIRSMASIFCAAFRSGTAINPSPDTASATQPT